jgi:L-lactate utilization protein LutB
MVENGPTSEIALWGLLITTAGGLVGRWLDNRKELRHRKEDLEDRATRAREIREDLVMHRDEIASALRKQIYENGTKEATERDTNATAHRIEDARA